MIYKNISIEVQRELDGKRLDSELIEEMQVERFIEGRFVRVDLLICQLSSEHNIVTESNVSISIDKEIFILLSQGELWVRLGVTPLLET